MSTWDQEFKLRQLANVTVRQPTRQEQDDLFDWLGRHHPDVLEMLKDVTWP